MVMQSLSDAIFVSSPAMFESPQVVQFEYISSQSLRIFAEESAER